MFLKRLIFIAFVSLGCHRNMFRTGDYDTTYKGLNYSIELFEDSTFRYIKRYEWPIEVTIGRWNLENGKLILNSIPDTFSERSQTVSNYILFKHKSFIVKHIKIIDLDTPQLKYNLYKQKH